MRDRVIKRQIMKGKQGKTKERKREKDRERERGGGGVIANARF
jgi:hypothetical protein